MYFCERKQKKESNERLEILNHSNDGFEIAEKDLKLRGPGDLFGIRQSGSLAFRLADIIQDAGILCKAKEAVERLLAEDPYLQAPENECLKEYIKQLDGNWNL